MNGPVVGGGVGLALAADMVLAASSAYFSLPFVPKLGLVPDQAMGEVRSVLNAAALTYVAATLQAVLTLLYLIMRYGGNDRD